MCALQYKDLREPKGMVTQTGGMNYVLARERQENYSVK